MEPFTLLDDLKSANEADFNDIYYFNLLDHLGENIPIVTHDTDFVFQDHDIITANKKLLGISDVDKA